MDFVNAEINVVVHATEDKDIIIDSLRNVLLLDTEKIEIVSSEGHWGNQILLMRLWVFGHDSSDLLKKIFSSLIYYDKEILSSIENFVDDKGYLYLRLDKQKLCKKKIRLGDNDSIRLKFKPVRKFKNLDIVDEYRRFFLSIE